MTPFNYVMIETYCNSSLIKVEDKHYRLRSDINPVYTFVLIGLLVLLCLIILIRAMFNHFQEVKRIEEENIDIELERQVTNKHRINKNESIIKVELEKKKSLDSN